jgi:hypothetical protein
MRMRFSPVSEEQAARLWPKGEYDAVVEFAKDTTSKSSGNEMLEVHFKVFGANGAEQKIRDYLVSTEGGAFKLQNFCKAADLWDQYQAGDLNAELCRDVRLTVKLGEEKGNDDYPPRNKITGYVRSKASADVAMPSAPAKRPLPPGVSPQQQRAAGTGRAEPTAPPTADDIPF